MNAIKIFIVLAFFFSGATFGYEYKKEIINNSIKENQKVFYCQKENLWGAKCGNPLVFTKHYTKGSGGFSEYELSGVTYDPDTTYEFLINNRLIGYNPHKLQFYWLSFSNNQFKRQLLSDEEIKTFFPNVEIVKISQFENEKIVLKKRFFEKKTYLFINDTQKDFYKYQFENSSSKFELIVGIFEPKFLKTYYFSHFKSRDKLTPRYRVVVRWKIN